MLEHCCFYHAQSLRVAKIALVAIVAFIFSLSLAGSALADDTATQTNAGTTTTNSGSAAPTTDTGTTGQTTAGTNTNLVATTPVVDVTTPAKPKINKAAITKPFKKPGTYYITLAKNTKKTIGMKDDKRIDNMRLVVAKKRAKNLYRFKISKAGKGLFYIKNVATGRYLTADLNKKKTGGVVRMNMKYDVEKYVDRYQKWEIVKNSDKSITITHPKTGLRLSLAGGKTAKGTLLKLNKPKAAKSGIAIKYQRFKLKKTKKNKNETVVLDVPCYWQNPQLPTGCESVALTNAINYWGFGLGKTTIAGRWMPYGSSGVWNFIGNPWNSSGWIICAPGITKTANDYLGSKDTNVSATNVSGTSMKGLRKYLDKGYPVVIWTTMYMGSPWNYDGSSWSGGHRYPFYHNNHAVVLSGYNPKTGKYKVSDSLSGRVWRNGGWFTSIYNTMGKQAVVLHDDGIVID